MNLQFLQWLDNYVKPRRSKPNLHETESISEASEDAEGKNGSQQNQCGIEHQAEAESDKEEGVDVSIQEGGEDVRVNSEKATEKDSKEVRVKNKQVSRHEGDEIRVKKTRKT